MPGFQRQGIGWEVNSMAGVRPEDLHVKIPALIHLTRLGYRYLPLTEADRDRNTNILPGDLRAAADRINGISLSDDAFADMLEEIRRSLALEDLGSCFFDGLRNSWRGIHLIDFSHPENNTCRVMTELPFVSGRNRFQPDITLLINGLPLAFIEVKNPRDGILSEYSRMIRRARNPHLRRFLNEAQIMVFSDNEEYDETGLMPRKGAFYATSAYDDLVFSHFEEEEREIFHQLSPPDPEEVSRICADSRLETGQDTLDLRASLSPDTPTHKLLTSLFHFRRVFFFLRYGITYLKEEMPDGRFRMNRQIIRYPQLFAVRFLEHQLRCGSSSGHWTVPVSGRAALAAVQIRYLTDYFADRNIPHQFFYLVNDLRRISGIRAEFLSRGFRVLDIVPPAGALPAPLREETWVHPPEPLVTLVLCDTADPSSFLRALMVQNTKQDHPLSGASPVRRVFFWDGTEEGYEISDPLPARLLSIDPDAFLIAFSQPS